MSRAWRVSTQPRGAPWFDNMYVHSDTEVPDSEHKACGGPTRVQLLSTVPPVTTDETAYASATGHASPYYCPRCNVRVEPRVTIYEEVRP